MQLAVGLEYNIVMFIVHKLGNLEVEIYWTMNYVLAKKCLNSFRDAEVLMFVLNGLLGTGVK